MRETKSPYVILQECKQLVKEALDVAKNGEYSTDSSKVSKMNLLLHPIDDKKEVSYKDIPDDMLNKIKESFYNIIDFIKSFLLTQDTAALWACFLCEIDIDINFNQRGFLGSSIGNRIAIYYNPLYMNEVNMTLNTIIGDTVVLLDRIINLHPSAYKELNPTADKNLHSMLEIGSNVSSSTEVVESIKYDKNSAGLKISDNICTKEDLENMISDSNPNKEQVENKQSIDYYYAVAKKYLPQAPSGGVSQGTGRSNSGSEKTNTSFPGSNSGFDCNDWENQVDDSEDTNDTITQYIRRAYDNMSDQQRGLLSAHMKSHIEKLFAPPVIDWKKRIRNCIGTIPFSHKKTSLRLDRRQPDRFDIKGVKSDKIVKICIAIDTSGSMSDYVLANYVFTELNDIVKSIKTEITVIECDAEIGRVYQVKSPKDIKYNVTGRGGTSYIPVINYINNNKYFRDALLIYFTDGYGDYEIPKPLDYKNIWVLTDTNRNCLSCKEPYGFVECITNDKKYMKLKNK